MIAISWLVPAQQHQHHEIAIAVQAPAPSMPHTFRSAPAISTSLCGWVMTARLIWSDSWPPHNHMFKDEPNAGFSQERNGQVVKDCEHQLVQCFKGSGCKLDSSWFRCPAFAVCAWPYIVCDAMATTCTCPQGSNASTSLMSLVPVIILVETFLFTPPGPS